MIAVAGGSTFNIIVWKIDEMSYILFNNSTPDSQKRYLLLKKLATGKTTVGPPTPVVVNLMVVQERMVSGGAALVIEIRS